MVEKISPIRRLYEEYKSELLIKDTSEPVLSFGKLLKESLQRLNQSQIEADKTIKSFLSGEIGDIHKVMLAVEKASLSLRLALQIRNKVIEAYQEIMRMQI